MAYEFEDQDAKVLHSVGVKALIIAFLMSFGGLIKAFFAVIDDRSNLILLSLRLIQALLQVMAGWIFFRPSDNLRRIQQTEGNDLEELFFGLEDMSLGLMTALFLVVASLLIDLGLFIMGVF